MRTYPPVKAFMTRHHTTVLDNEREVDWHDEIQVEGEYSPGEPQTWEDPGCPSRVEYVTAYDESGDEICLSDEDEREAQAKLENALDDYERDLGDAAADYEEDDCADERD